MQNDIIDISEDLNHNFGGGVELLMNSSRPHTGGNAVNIDDLDTLENDLMELQNNQNSLENPDNDPSYSSSHKFNSVAFQDIDNTTHHSDGADNIGKLTGKINTPTETWDGFSNTNTVGGGGGGGNYSRGFQPESLTNEELTVEKHKYLSKIKALERAGVEFLKTYTMDSPLAEMKAEYDIIMDNRAKKSMRDTQRHALKMCVGGLEWLNGRFELTDFNLDGWGDQIGENIDNFDDVFEELYDKWKSNVSLIPELKLLFMVGGSGMMVHMTNTMFKTAPPGMDAILRQNPALMQQFQSAVVNSMAPTNPGLAGFMGEVNRNQQQQQSQRPPPPPMATQTTKSGFPPPPNNRPDISVARGNYADAGISVHDNYGTTETEYGQSKRPVRPEMHGPTPASSLSAALSAIKTKNITIDEPPSSTIDGPHTPSIVSVNDLSTIPSSTALPTKSVTKRRAKKNTNNTVSLDM